MNISKIHLGDDGHSFSKTATIRTTEDIVDVTIIYNGARGKLEAFQGMSFTLGHDDARRLSAELVSGLPEKLKFVPPKPAKVSPKRPHGAQEYRGNGNHGLEVVCPDQSNNEWTMTQRLRVPGGWLYKTQRTVGDATARVVSTTFVPVPDAVGYAV